VVILAFVLPFLAWIWAVPGIFWLRDCLTTMMKEWTQMSMKDIVKISWLHLGSVLLLTADISLKGAKFTKINP